MLKASCASIVLVLASGAALAEGKVTYLSCPGLDSRANDLRVIIDQPNGTASLSSQTAGSGLNFTAPASFGPDKVSWKKKSSGLVQDFTVDRASLVLDRRTKFTYTENVSLEKAQCTILEKAKNAKF